MIIRVCQTPIGYRPKGLDTLRRTLYLFKVERVNRVITTVRRAELPMFGSKVPFLSCPGGSQVEEDL